MNKLTHNLLKKKKKKKKNSTKFYEVETVDNHNYINDKDSHKSMS